MAFVLRYGPVSTTADGQLEGSMEPEELRIEEADIRELVDRLVRVGAPQALDSLTDWYIGIVVERVSGEQGR